MHIIVRTDTVLRRLYTAVHGLVTGTPSTKTVAGYPMLPIPYPSTASVFLTRAMDRKRFRETPQGAAACTRRRVIFTFSTCHVPFPAIAWIYSNVSLLFTLRLCM
jgi:hypothetical protein